MPITFTAGLTPTFPVDSFGSAKEHEKQLATALTGGTAFFNPLDAGITALVDRIDVIQASLAGEISASLSEKTTILNRGFSNLPQGWLDAAADGQSGYTHNNMSDVYEAINDYYNHAVTLDTHLTTLKNYLSQVDVDNFKLHMELLSGIDDAPPMGVLKPNLNGLMGLASSITDIENRFGIAFTNHLTGLFGTLFTGDVTIAAAQTHMDTDPLSAGTYQSLSVLTNVDKAYVINATGDDRVWNDDIVESKLTPLFAPFIAHSAQQATHLAAFTAHITTDMAYYYTVVDKLKQYVQVHGVSGHIQDPYYAFMYTDVFGSASVNDIITLLQNGDIT
jgi:hypothetical protein